MHPCQRHVVEHRGCPLSYEVRGDGPSVLFIQGVGVHGSGWNPQINDLAVNHRCLSYDNRGIGASQPIGAPLTIEQLAEDARVLMDAQGWKSAHVVGHSMGGLIALQLALSAREHVRSLSLLCTFARGRDATRLSPWIMWTGMRTRIGTKRMRRHVFLEMVMPRDQLRTLDRDALAAHLAPIFGHDLADQPPIVMKQLAAISACDLTQRLGELKGLPTLVVSAAHDRIAPVASGRALAVGIPGANFVGIADASHGVPILNAERINALLNEHFARAESK